MTHVDVVGYRDWAYESFVQALRTSGGANVMHYTKDTATVCQHAEVVFLVGWSALVAPEFYRKRMVLVVHPSVLPEYRGGSPIQHQIIAGLSESAVSIFRLDDDHPGVDSGPLCFQRGYSLAGSLADVLESIAEVTAVGIGAILDQYPNVHFWEQADPRRSPMRRRSPDESEITQLDFAIYPARALYNKIRALQDPYPNAFIVCADGRRLYLTCAHLDEAEDVDAKAGDSPAR